MERANFKERALYLISPEKGARAYRERVRKERLERQQGMREAATGYGNHGASKTLNSMVGWIVGGGAAEDDIDLQGATLRQRARDLYAGGGLAKSGPDTLTAATVAWGIMPSPKIDGEKLGLSDEKADQWERQTLREFRLWASSPQCDAERSKNFYALQKLAFLSMLMSGDVFALFGMKENKRTPYQTTIRLLEADRICTPDTDGDSDVKETESGGRIVDGVEISKDGEVIRYHIASRHPLRENDTENVSWTAIEAYGKDTGYPNILNDLSVRPLTDQVNVFRAAEKPYTIKAAYKADRGENLAEDMAECVKSYQSWQDGTIGRTFNPDRLMAAMYQAGAERVAWQTGSAFGEAGAIEYTEIPETACCKGTITLEVLN